MGDNRQWCVYYTENPNSGKYYIGKSWVSKVNKGYQGSGTYIKNCKKGGAKMNTIIVIVFDNEQHAYDYEAHLISECKDDPLCMNICDDNRPPIRYGADNNKSRAVIDVDTKEVFTNAAELSTLLEYAATNQVPINISKGIKCRDRTIAWLDEYEDGTWQDKMNARNLKSRSYSTNKRRSTKRRPSPEEVRQIYYMKNFTDMTQVDICEIFDMPRHTVYKIGARVIYKQYLPYE